MADSYGGNFTSSGTEWTFRLSSPEKASRITLGVLVFFENSISLYALKKATSMQTSLRYCLTSLSMAHVLSGLTFAYHSAVFDLIQFREVNFECWVRHICLTSLTVVVLTTVATLTLDRIFALFHPFTYRIVATELSFVCILVAEWLLSVAVTMTAYAVGNLQNICHFSKMASTATYAILSLVRCLMVVIIVTGQMVMFCLAKRHIKKIVPGLVTSSQIKTAVRMNIKAIVTTSVIVLPFLVCVTPLYLGYLYATIRPHATRLTEWKIFLSFAISLFMVNGILNPVIYCWRLSEVRIILKNLFCKKSAVTNKKLSSAQRSTLKSSSTATCDVRSRF